VVRIPLAVDIEDTGDSYATIRKLGIPGEDSTHAVTEYLVRQYVVFRESYKYDEQERALNFVRQFSSPEVYAGYTGYLDLKNAASPVSRLHETGVIDVNILSADIAENHKATVIFETTEKSTGLPRITKYRADITFKFTNISYDSRNKKFTPLDFMVQDYVLTNLS
jgi:type IV secretory pathway component VirB8